MYGVYLMIDGGGGIYVGEEACSVLEEGSEWRYGKLVGAVKFNVYTKVKLARYNAVR